MLIRARRSREIMLKVFFLLSGFLYAALFADIRLSDSLPQKWEGRDIEITGVVADLPQSNAKGQYFRFDVEKADTPGAHVPEKIMLSRYDRKDGAVVHPGERWRFTVRLKRPHGDVNPYGFDFEAWLLERGIRATGYVRDGTLLKGFVARPFYLIESMREKLRKRILDTHSSYSGVIAALLMGDQKAISEKDWQTFRRTGVIHLMSISGLHVTMVAALFAFLAYRFWRNDPARMLWLPARKFSALIGLLSAFCYALLAGYAVPTQRTVYMLAVVAAALWSGRITSPTLILCWALFAVTLFDPWCVLSPGLWLSFAAVLFILYAGTGRIARKSWLNAWLSVQWAVTIGLVPILLVFFRQISLISPIANAVAIPVVSFVVVPLTLFGAISPFDFPFLLAAKIFSLLMLFLERLSDLPDAVWIQHAPLEWAVVAAFAGIFWLLLPKGFPVRWLGVSGIAPLFLFYSHGPQSMRLTVLDVGQGLSSVIETRHHALLFDAGPVFSPGSDSGNRIIVPFLVGSGISRLDGVILSHEDMDHIGGAISVLNAVPTGWLLSSLPEGNPVLLHAGLKFVCHGGQSWTWDEVRFEILSPDSAIYSNRKATSNERSCVLRVTSPDGSILITGDIDKGIQEKLASKSIIRADVLVVPHHGGSSSGKFIRAVSPRYAVFSVGYRNRFHHPRKDVVALYRDLGSRIVRTDEGGAAIFDFLPAGITGSSWRDAHRRYWYQEK